jgi:hypothetical protein
MLEITMNTSVKIEKFNRLMQAEQAPNTILAVLRQLTDKNAQRPSAARDPKPLGSWSGWSYY